MSHGYGGHILRVDLSGGTIRREKTDPAYALKTIGGRGLNSWRLHDELKREIDPLAEESMLLIGVGPLTGTLLSTSAYMTISGKSPLTGILGDSAAGGHFGPVLKQAGYDQLIITGRRARPCYLLIADDRVEIRDAAHLWGRDIFETTAAIRQELNDHAV
ncbi:MAG: aldehyde:ferredoxin oxidoreductase, partial [Desulfobacteraceae bacterium]